MINQPATGDDALTGISAEEITGLLAERVMGWSAAPDRFLMGNRRWMPRWRFAPMTNLEDAFRLLDAAKPAEYTIRGRATGEFQVRVRLADGSGEARDTSRPRAIACAVALALGIDVEVLQ